MTNDELEAAIDADPDSDDGFLVYGDWLMERGSPRGTLVVLDQNLIDEPWGEAGRAFRKQRAELLREHNAELVGPFASDDSISVAVEWHLGFARRIRISGKGKPRVIQRRVAEILRHPSSRFIRELELGPLSTNGRELQSAELLASGFADQRLPTLRRLTLGRPIFARWPAGGSIDAVIRAAPNLRDLSVAATGELETFDASRLTRLSLWLHGVRRHHILLLQTCTALERAEVFLGESEVRTRDLTEVIEKLPDTVNHLGLRGSEAADELVAEIPLTVASLDFSMGRLGDGGAARLAKRVEANGQTRRLDVRECMLGNDGIAALEGSFEEVIVGHQGRADTQEALLEDAQAAISVRSERSRQLASARQFADAFPAAESALRLASSLGFIGNEKGAIRKLAEICNDSDRIEELIRYRKQALWINPHWYERQALATALSRAGRNHEAEEVLENAIEQETQEKYLDHLRLELAGVRVSLGIYDIKLCERLSKTKEYAKSSRVWDILGNAYLLAGRPRKAAAAFESAFRFEERASSKLCHQCNLGQAKMQLGELKDAEAIFSRVIAEADESGMLARAASARGMLGRLLVNSGRPLESVQFLEEAAATFHEAGLIEQEGYALSNLGLAYAASERNDDARMIYARACEIHRNSGNFTMLANTLASLAGIFFDEDDFDRAIELATEALELARSRDDFWSQGTCHSQLGSVFLAKLNLTVAKEHFERAVVVSGKVHNQRWRAWNRGMLGRVEFADGQPSKAAELTREAIESLTPLADDEMLGRLKTGLAAIAFVWPEIANPDENAESILDQARAHLDRCGVVSAKRRAKTVAAFIGGQRPSGGHFSQWLCAALDAAAE